MDSATENFSSLLQAIFEHVDDAIYVKAADGRYVVINPAGARIFGLRPEDVIGRRDEEFFGAESAADITATDQHILATGQSTTYESRRRVAGAEMVFLTTKLPYERPDTGDSYIIGISRDITGKNRLEQELAMDDQYASVGALAGGVAHEINNPLTYTLTGLESVIDELAGHERALGELRRELDQALGPDRAAQLLARAGVRQAAVTSALERAREAHHGSERVREIVRGLSSFARPADTAVTSVDVHELLDSAIKMASVELRYRARVVCEYGDIPLVRGQEHQLRQLFLNLLVGIARSLPEGGSDTHEIHIATSATAREICVEVHDTGTAVDESTSRKLGMSIVRYVVSAHDGGVDVLESTGGRQGVRIRLPVEPQPAPEPRAEARPATPSQDRARVLVVDDEPLIRMLLGRMLGRKHEVKEAESGADAVELLEQGESFDAILCDLMMPRMTGIDVYHWLERHRPDLVDRIGFVTGGVFTDRGQAFIQGCSRPVLEKPFDRKTVECLLEQLLH